MEKTLSLQEGKLRMIYDAIERNGYTDTVLYMILELYGCPITLPKAFSMSQAASDLKHRKESIIEWFKNNEHPIPHPLK